MDKQQLSREITSIIYTLRKIVERFGLTFKFPIEGETEQDIKEERAKLNQHFKFLGEVGLVSEFTINNNNNVEVTIAPHIIAFYATFYKEIDLISNSVQTLKHDEVIKAFNKMFPQDNDHCSECCPYIEYEDD